MSGEDDTNLNELPATGGKSVNHEENRSIWGDATSNLLDDMPDPAETRSSAVLRAMMQYDAKSKTWIHYVTFSLCLFFVVLAYGFMGYSLLIQAIKVEEWIAPLGIIFPISLCIFNFIHSVAVLGLPMGVFWLFFILIYTFTAETVGVWTGWLYGAYHYTNIISAHAGYVPVTIPFSWYMMLWPAYCISDLVVFAEPHYKLPAESPRAKLLINVAAVSVLTAVVMIGWDMVADPQGSTASCVWRWEHDHGYYLGVPLLNFVGWFFTVVPLIAILSFLFHALPPIWPILKIEHWKNHHAILCVCAYASVVIFYVFLSFPVFLTAIAIFTMAVPLLLASMRLLYGALHPKQTIATPSRVNFDSFYDELN